jgi:hypothetical protein
MLIFTGLLIILGDRGGTRGLGQSDRGIGNDGVGMKSTRAMPTMASS